MSQIEAAVGGVVLLFMMSSGVYALFRFFTRDIRARKILERLESDRYYFVPLDEVKNLNRYLIKIGEREKEIVPPLPDKERLRKIKDYLFLFSAAMFIGSIGSLLSTGDWNYAWGIPLAIIVFTIGRI